MMVKIRVDEKDIEVPEHYTLLQAAEAAGVEIPRFCFHEKLSIAGNCRMCLVEVKGGPPKPQASCALGVRDLRPGPNGEPAEIYTASPMVIEARAGVLDFLLANHPLDCPICDQGGECDLQDQAAAYGRGFSRFCGAKRAVEDKFFGPLIKTAMTRCIHCTRCIRFSTEVAGVPELGMIGRGQEAEVTNYLEHLLSSELQGNVIDLCPVGALTSRPYAFVARPWELHKTETIDVMDGLGSAIRVDSRREEILRILPRVHEEVNGEWISDKTRFCYDGLGVQRLDRPYVRRDGRLQPASWSEAFDAIKGALDKVSPSHIGAIAGDLAAVEEMYALKRLLEKLGSDNVECRQEGSCVNPNLGRASYLFNSHLAGIEQADAILLIGCNPRLEAAVLNARILTHQRHSGVPIGVIGEAADLRFPYHHLGSGSESLTKLLAGEDSFWQVLEQAKYPLVILGSGALVSYNGVAVIEKALELLTKINGIRPDWNGYNILHMAAGRVGGLDLGFVPRNPQVSARSLVRSMEVLFLLGADEVDLGHSQAFLIYIGSHGDKGATAADVILPGCAYTEKSATYVNTEGRVQQTNRATFPVGEAREDWAIVRALSQWLDVPLSFDCLSSLREELYETYPHMQQVGVVQHEDLSPLLAIKSRSEALKKEEFLCPIKDYYKTNPIARASITLAECSALAKRRLANSLAS